jgi:hypothetical protein
VRRTALKICKKRDTALCGRCFKTLFGIQFGLRVLLTLVKFCSMCEVCTLQTELQNTLPFLPRAPINCRLPFTHQLEDQTEHSAFSQRRSQQTFPTATPQAQYLLVIKHVICGNPPSYFPYFLHSTGRKNRVSKLRKFDFPRLL